MTMNPQNNRLPTSGQNEQKLWEHKLEMIAQENDSLLNLLVSLQSEHRICTKHEEKTSIFFNYFQYFFQLIRHLKESLIIIDVGSKADEKNISNYDNLIEELNNLEKKHQTFKNNFRIFILNSVHGCSTNEIKIA